MNPTYNRLSKFIAFITLLSMVFANVLPAAQFALAQEATEEPAVTEIPTETVTQPPVETTPPPAAVVTEEAVVPATENAEMTPEVTPAVTAEISPLPTTEIPVISLFQDNFQDGNTDGWELTPGWGLVAEGENTFLRALTGDETAAVSGLTLDNLLLAARVRITAGNTLSIAVRGGVENYTITLDDSGSARLYRGETLLAEAAVNASDVTPEFVPWHTVNIQAFGATLMVSVDGSLQISYTDPTPLSAGTIRFSASAANTGAVDIDEVMVSQLETPVMVEPTSQPTEAAAPTRNPETTPEAAQEAAETVNEPILHDDFEGDAADVAARWMFGAGTGLIAESEANHAVLLAANSDLRPANPLILGDFQLDMRFNITTDTADSTPSGLSLSFRTQEGRGYVLSLEAGQTVLYRNDGETPALLASAPLTHALNTWHSLSLNARGGQITVSVDGVTELDYADEKPLTSGQIAFAANNASSVMLDDIIVHDWTPAAALEAAPTPVPLGITDENKTKLDGALFNILNLYMNGDPEGALRMAAESKIPIDENGRVAVIVWGAEGITGETIAPLVETTGGLINQINEFNVSAHVPLTSLVALINVPEVFAIWLQPVAVSTSSSRSGSASAAFSPSGTVASEGFDATGAQTWHLAGITGGAQVAIIDTGFAGIASIPASERACLTSTTPVGGAGTGNHGNMVAQVVCDMAPAAGSVTLYTASNATQLLSRLNDAQNAGSKVILITMDLGAHVSPGDGGCSDAVQCGDMDDVYQKLADLRSAGVIIVASAGNSNFSAADPTKRRYQSFTATTGTTVTMALSSGDRVSVSWNAWGGSAFPNMTLTGGNGSYTSRTSTMPAGVQFTITNGGSQTLTFNSVPGSLYVQVQITGSADSRITGGSAAFDTLAGTIARPADSPNVIAVGAVCLRQLFPYNPTVAVDSSVGPIFASGGNANTPLYSPPRNLLTNPYKRDEVKPDVVAPTYVSTTIEESSKNCSDGFTGTSAAAAHVAGMVALMVSNTNSSMDVFDQAGPEALTTVKDYLQTHAAELPFGALADGFDMTHGAGMPVLGDPDFDLTRVMNPTLPPDDPRVTLPASPQDICASLIYVGQANAGDPLMDGTIDHPYIHPAYAIKVAAADQCVVIMPGEYATPLFVNGLTNSNVTLISYDAVRVADEADSYFWVNNTFLDITGPVTSIGTPEAGLVINTTTTFAVEGFTFKSGSIFDNSSYVEPQALFIKSGSGIEFRNNIIDGFNLNRSVAAVYSSNSVKILNNQFINNTSRAGLPVFYIQESGLLATRTIVQGNTFQNNVSRTASYSLPSGYPGSGIAEWSPILASIDSYTDITSNVFTANTAETIVQATTKSGDDDDIPIDGDPIDPEALIETRILGNVFLNNIIDSTDIASNTGPLVNLFYVPRFYFINNTAVGNVMKDNLFGAIISRGDNNIVTIFGSLDGIHARWEIHNNLLYNNTAPGEIVRDASVAPLCTNIAGDPNQAMHNNWIFNSGANTVCNAAFTNPANHNIDTDPINEFAGTLPGSTLLPTEPIYYAFRFNSAGLDAGDNTKVSDTFLPPAGSFLTDAQGQERITPPGGVIDIGAYELVALEITAPGKIVNLTCTEDVLCSADIRLPAYGDIIGGVGKLTYTLLGAPLNYGTQCGPAFSGTFGIIFTGDIMSYCAPRDFYNFGIADPNATVTFGFRVQDQVGSQDEGTVIVTVNPVLGGGDVTQATTIGDGTPVQDIFEVVENARTDTDINLVFRLRPYVRFGNFFFSERNNTEGTASREVNYPFTYGNLTRVGGDAPTTLLPNTLIPAANGTVTHTLTVNGKGYADYEYTVDDADAGTTPNVTNRVRIIIVSQIPDKGLHDDTSFAFDYTGKWTPLYNEATINNTLHQTLTTGDKADFRFTGKGFVLYMQGDTAGGKWELQIDGQKPNWTAPVNGVATGTITSPNITCTTRSVPDTVNDWLSNLGALPYTVSCGGTGFTSGTIYKVTIINRENKRLNVDAIGIMEDGATTILSPGFHDMDEYAIRQIFQGKPWVQSNDASASNKIAMITPAPVGTLANYNFNFSFKGGTGFAIGTTLENKIADTPIPLGAQYEICVQETGQPTTEVCQDFNNGLGGTTSPLWKTFRPFFGFDPDSQYDVTFTLKAVPNGERMVIDSIVVFTDDTRRSSTGSPVALPLGPTEDDARDMFVFGSGLEDTWKYDTGVVTASNRSLTSITTTFRAGPFIGFRIPDSADAFYWQRSSLTNDSTNLMICINRAAGIGAGPDNAGNCILVNLKTGTYMQQLANGTFAPDATAPKVVQPAKGMVYVDETMFRTGWGTGPHTVEIFSLTNEQFNLDKVIVLSASAPLPAGYYEESTINLKYFNNDAPAYTFDDGVAPESSFTPKANTAASGGVVTASTEVGEGLFFEFDGTGFSVYFSIDTKADAVKICWLAGAGQTVNNVLTTGTCQIFDNQSTVVRNKFARTILGLHPAAYSVAVQMLDDNFTPTTHTAASALPLTMQIDAVEIYNDPWFVSGSWNDATNLNVLTPGMRYETSYANRAAEKNFLYYGGAWKSITGTAANAYSGKNYDQTINAAGAGILFRTNNADAMILYRDSRAGFTPLLVCAAPMNAGATAVDLSRRYCTVINNAVGSFVSQPYGVLFNTLPNADPQRKGPYVVTINTLEVGTFNLDAIELLDTDSLDGAGSSPRILGAGLYEEFNPALIYDRSYSNLIVNGEMERDADWTAIGGLPPASNTRFTTRYTGTYSRGVLNAALNQGIRSQAFNVTSGTTYVITAHVYVLTKDDAVTMRVNGTPAATDVSTLGTFGKWETLQIVYTPAASGPVTLDFFASTVTGGAATGTPPQNTVATFYVDAVSVNLGGLWRPLYNTTASAGRLMESLTYGAQMNFAFRGTGFEVGTLIDRFGGEVEICYDDNPALSSPDCFIYQNEFASVNATTSRPMVGLPLNIYYVRVRDVENGITTLVTTPNTPRPLANDPARLRIDYVRIFDTPAPNAVPAGLYNENQTYVDGSGNNVPYLQLFPSTRWGTISGMTAFSGQSYTTIVGTTGTASSVYAGPAALLTVGQNDTIILFTGKPSTASSDQILACADRVVGNITDPSTINGDTTDDCVLITNLKTSSQIVVNAGNLPNLADPGSHTVSFRSLKPAPFIIDGFQVIDSTTLPAGYYEEVIGSSPAPTSILRQLSGTWTTSNNALFSGGSALVSTTPDASMQFSFQGTGFSLVTLLDSVSGEIGSTNVRVTVSGIDLNGSDPGTDALISTFNSAALYKSAISFTGLPFNTYTVTITEDYGGALLNRNKLVIDAIEVYGDLPLLGSLYDDTETDAAGSPLLAFGPNNASWTVRTGTAAVGYLNQTVHYTKTPGATLSFRVGAVGSVVLYTGKVSKAVVEVCWIRTQPTTSARVCSPQFATTTTIGNHKVDVPAAIAGGTEYRVSVVNKSANLDLFIDAVQTVKPGTLIEGVYQETYADLAYGGTTTDVANTSASDGKVKSLAGGASLEFKIEGVGFSIVLVESTATSGSYKLCVNQGSSTSGGTSCNTINQALVKPATSSGQNALTYMGLQTAGGNDNTYFVYIQNTDPTVPTAKALLIDRVEVMGKQDTTLKITTSDKVENTEPQIEYFPFGSLLSVTNAAASGGNQHSGNARGSTIYFEFQGRGFEYFRQLSTTYGQVEICVGRIDDATTPIRTASERRCATYPNNTTNAYQRPLVIEPQSIVDGALPALPATYCVAAPGCWVSITNKDNKVMTFDFVRLFDPTGPLKEGYYEAESYPAFKFFDNLAPTYPFTGSSFALKNLAGTSGGAVMTTSPTTNQIGEGMFFEFAGTGFSVLFSIDNKADAVRICWLEGAGQSVNNVLTTGICQTFDNQSATARNLIARSVLGLHPNTYSVAVQMLEDNFMPTTHVPTATAPITMQIDAVQVYNTSWFNGSDWNDNTDLNVLNNLGVRYETSYANRVVEKNFQYFGSKWKSFSGTTLTAYSGRNYDQTIGEAGAGIIFRTSGANAMILYRDVTAGYTPLMVCASPLTGSPLKVTGRYCTLVNNATGTGRSQPYGVLFNTTGNTGPHVVTITALEIGTFNLDAIELMYTAPLTAGLYEEFHPALIYDRSYTNLIINGDMERDSDWTAVSMLAANNTRSSTTRFNGTYSRRANANAAGQGIQSLPFTLQSGQSYSISAHVFLRAGAPGSIRMQVVNNADTPIPGTTIISPSGTSGRWITLRVNFTPGSTITGAKLRFTTFGGQCPGGAPSCSREFFVDAVVVANGGIWQPIYATTYSGGRMMESRTTGAKMTFQFNGTGFEVGTLIDRFGGEVEICYGLTAGFPGNAKCFTYQNESAVVNATTSRPVVGLNSGIYTVTVAEKDDGITALTTVPNTPRPAANDPARVRIDYVRIFNDALPPTTPAGNYNENSIDSGGNRYLQLLPAGRWGSITGSAASAYSGKSYATVVSNTGTLSTIYAGPAAVMRVDVPSASGATIVVYTGVPASNKTDQLLVCADNVSGNMLDPETLDGDSTDDCVLIKDQRTTSQVVLSPLNLPALAVPGLHTLTFRALTPGQFTIDGFQILFGDTLVPGIFNEFTPDNILNFTPNVVTTTTPACNPANEWCYLKVAKAFGGSVARTSKSNATLRFNILGTGFSIITEINGGGADMRVCYAQKSVFDGDFTDVGVNGEFCQNFTTNSGANWNTLNAGRIPPGTVSQYGFSFYGLPEDEYTVEVRLINPAATRFLQIDAVAVFGDVAAEIPLVPGLYDDPSIAGYEPVELWSQLAYAAGPPKGGFNRTEHQTINAGAVLQLFVQGNALTLFQTVDTGGSRHVQICLIVKEDVVHCGGPTNPDKPSYQVSEFSQNKSTTTYFTPIVFYGLGTGTHKIIIENRDHNRKFRFDAALVWN